MTDHFCRGVWLGTWLTQSCNRRPCLLWKRCRLQNCTKRCLLSNKPSCSVLGNRALARPGLPCTSPRQISANAEWRMATALRLGLTPDAHVCLAPRQRRGRVRTFADEAPVSLILLQVPGQGQTASCGPVHTACCSPKREDMRTFPRAVRLG